MVTSFRERLENTFDISQRPLLPSQEKRVEPIMRELSKEQIKLTHFITLTYPYKNISWKNTVKDNERTNRILRKFAKYYLRVLWFTERHDSGGFHRHGLIEDPFKVYDAIGTLNSREDLSRVARTVFDKTSLEMLSWNGSEKVTFQERLLRNALIEHNSSLADNDYSCVIKRESDIRSRVSYCTKQFWTKGMEPSDVIDFKNSNVDPSIIDSWSKIDYFDD